MDKTTHDPRRIALEKLKNFCGVMIAFDERTMRYPGSDLAWFDGRIAGYQNVIGEIDRQLEADDKLRALVTTEEEK